MARVYETQGKYEKASENYLRAKRPVESAKCAMKVARSEVLNDDFLPEIPTSKVRAVAIRLAMEAVNADSDVPVKEKQSITLERRLLKNHASFKLGPKFTILLSECQDSADALRLTIMAVRCLVKNMICKTVKHPQGEESIELSTRDYVTGLCGAVGAMRRSINTFLSNLDAQETSQSKGLITDSVRQCEEMFECIRGRSAFGKFKYLVDSIPAALHLYFPIPAPPTPPPVTTKVITAIGRTPKVPPKSVPVPVTMTERPEIECQHFIEKSRSFLTGVLEHTDSFLLTELRTKMHQVKNGSISIQSVLLYRMQDIIGALLSDQSALIGCDLLVSQLIDYDFFASVVPPPLATEDMSTTATYRLLAGVQLWVKRFVRPEISGIYATTFQSIAQKALLIDLAYDVTNEEKHRLLKDLEKACKNHYRGSKLCAVFAFETNGAGGRQQQLSQLLWECKNSLCLPESPTMNMNYTHCFGVASESYDAHLTLIEKYVVIGLLYRGRGWNALIPRSVLMSVMSRRSAYYADFIRNCTREDYYWGPAPNVMCYIPVLFSILSQIESEIKDGRSPLPLVVARVYSLILTICVNMRPEYNAFWRNYRSSYQQSRCAILRGVPQSLKDFVTALKLPLRLDEMAVLYRSLNDDLLSVTHTKDHQNGRNSQREQGVLTVSATDDLISIIQYPKPSAAVVTAHENHDDDVGNIETEPIYDEEPQNREDLDTLNEPDVIENNEAEVQTLPDEAVLEKSESIIAMVTRVFDRTPSQRFECRVRMLFRKPPMLFSQLRNEFLTKKMHDLVRGYCKAIKGLENRIELVRRLGQKYDDIDVSTKQYQAVRVTTFDTYDCILYRP